MTGASSRRRVGQWAARALARTPATLPRALAPMISFTFDDVPASAVAVAAPMLEAAGFAGTWYASVGLIGTTGVHGPIAGAAELRRLHEAGHEIGNHTFGHIDAHAVDADAYGGDIDRNADALAALGLGRAVSFSYPFGGATAGAKRIAAARAASCRGIRPGVIRGSVDLGLLPAYPIYSADGPPAALERVVAEVRDRGGWAIFYTHDVRDAPSAWGCTPDHFAALVASVRAAGVQVTTVGDAVARITR